MVITSLVVRGDLDDWPCAGAGASREAGTTGRGGIAAIRFGMVVALEVVLADM